MWYHHLGLRYKWGPPEGAGTSFTAVRSPARGAGGPIVKGPFTFAWAGLLSFNYTFPPPAGASFFRFLLLRKRFEGYARPQQEEKERGEGTLIRNLCSPRRSDQKIGGNVSMRKGSAGQN
jgi:hypothetical protein